MTLYKKLLRYWLNRQGMRVALELAAANGEYRTLVAIHGRNAYIYADVMAAKAGRVEALITELDFINAKRDRLKLAPVFPKLDPDLLDTSKEAGK